MTESNNDINYIKTKNILLIVSQIRGTCLLDLVHVFLSVLIRHVRWADVQLEVRPKIFKVIVVWELWKNIINVSD